MFSIYVDIFLWQDKILNNRLNLLLLEKIFSNYKIYHTFEMRYHYANRKFEFLNNCCHLNKCKLSFYLLSTNKLHIFLYLILEYPEKFIQNNLI